MANNYYTNFSFGFLKEYTMVGNYLKEILHLIPLFPCILGTIISALKMERSRELPIRWGYLKYVVSPAHLCHIDLTRFFLLSSQQQSDILILIIILNRAQRTRLSNT